MFLEPLSFHDLIGTRSVIHNGHVTNLISANNIYDKLVIGRGKIKNKSILMYIMLLYKKKIHDLFFIFDITLVMRNSKGTSP